MPTATLPRQRGHAATGAAVRAMPQRRPWAARLIGSLPDASAGHGWAACAASADLAHALDPRRVLVNRPAVDPLGLRDPEYIRRTVPGLRAMSELYFRADVRGIGNVPAGPVLLVGNHSGGWLIATPSCSGRRSTTTSDPSGCSTSSRTTSPSRSRDCGR